MSKLFDVNPMIPLAWLVTMVIGLMVFFAWNESRKPYRFRALRVAAQMVSMLALLGLMLRPSYTVNIPKPALVLLTENYSGSALDSLMRNNQSLRIVSAPGVAGRDGVLSIRSFRELAAMGDVTLVLGDGIPVHSLEVLRDDPFVYLPGNTPNGIVSLRLGPFETNRRNILRGEVRAGDRTKLTLMGPGGVEDSVRFRKAGLHEFQLAFTTKRPGQYVYTLVITDSTGRKSEEVVPIEVKGARMLRILLLQTYPQAEVKFLKNYLAEKGHKVTTRYQLSKGVYRFEFSNTPTSRPGTLNSALLEEFDLVITDDESFERLPANELLALEEGTDRGLGLLILLQRVPDSKRFPGSVLAVEREEDQPDTIRYTLPGYGSFVNPFTALQPLPSSSIQPILQSGRQVLSGFMLQGEGKVAFQSLRETYRLALGGEAGPYAALWTPLLEQTARREDTGITARLAADFPVYPDEPISIEIIGSGPLEVLSSGGDRIPLAEDVRIDDFWHGTLWADQAGWTSISIGDGSRLNLFIAEDGSWKSLRRANQQARNARVSSRVETTANDWSVSIPVSPWIFFVGFLLAFGFVWLGPKL